jgi:hypothetical protein
VVRGIAERLVDVPVHVRVEGDHLADGHEVSFVIASLAEQSSLRSFFCGLLGHERFPHRRKKLRMCFHHCIVLTLFTETRS